MLIVILHKPSCLKSSTIQFDHDLVGERPWGALGYVLGGYVPPGTPNWHPVEKNFPKIDTPL